jgi:hypothetical protein
MRNASIVLHSREMAPGVGTCTAMAGLAKAAKDPRCGFKQAFSELLTCLAPAEGTHLPTRTKQAFDPAALNVCVGNSPACRASL